MPCSAYQRSKICVGSNCRCICKCLSRHWGRFDHTSFAATGFFKGMQPFKRALRQTQPVIEDTKHGVVDFKGLADEWGHNCWNCRGSRCRVCSVNDIRKGKRVVLCDVDEFDGVQLTGVNILSTNDISRPSVTHPLASTALAPAFLYLIKLVNSAGQAYQVKTRTQTIAPHRPAQTSASPRGGVP